MISPAGGLCAQDPTGDALLVRAACGDAAVLAQFRARHAAGEPAAYVAGFLVFRGRRFLSDPRAYVTDPELTYLVDQVHLESEALRRRLGRAPRVLEFGTGAGTLALTLALERLEAQLMGIDLDAQALALARENAALHGLDFPVWESDYFSGLPPAVQPPDLLFGDPPWGGPTDLYDTERDGSYYDRMPAKSAYPGGPSPCGIHDELIRRVAALGWPTVLVLNYGVLPEAEVRRSASPLAHAKLLHPRPELTLLVGCAR